MAPWLIWYVRKTKYSSPLLFVLIFNSTVLYSFLSPRFDLIIIETKLSTKNTTMPGKFSQVKIINFISKAIYPLTSFVVKQLFLVVFLKQRGTPILLPGSLRVHQILLKHSRNLPKPDSLPIQIRVRMPSNMLLLLHEEKDWHTATTSILTVSFSLAFTSWTTQSISLRSISKIAGMYWSFPWRNETHQEVRGPSGFNQWPQIWFRHHPSYPPSERDHSEVINYNWRQRTTICGDLFLFVLPILIVPGQLFCFLSIFHLCFV